MATMATTAASGVVWEDLPVDARCAVAWAERVVCRARQVGWSEGRGAKVAYLFRARRQVEEALGDRGRLGSLVRARGLIERSEMAERVLVARERIERDVEGQLEMGFGVKGEG